MPGSRRRTGRRAATLRDVGRVAGVSAMTASRALHRPDLVAPETAARVRDAAAELAYVPNRLAGGLSTRRSLVVIAVVPSTLNPGFSELVHALRDELLASGYQLFLGLSDYARSQEDQLLDAIVGRRPDGIVLTGVVHSPELRRRLSQGHIPVVETWDLTSRPIDMLVGFSNLDVGRAAAEHLIARGRRRLALVVADDQRAQARRAGFRAVLEQRGLPLSGELVVRAPSTVADGRGALSRLLESKPGIDAVFCSSDHLALGVLFEATARGLRIPGELSLMGFGDLPMSAHTVPPLTTVAVDGARIGRESARLLLRRFAGAPRGGVGRDRILDVGFAIVSRGTT
jgi:LacI family transcriptional regulator, gluconate utilization system Gnt-I transcriptional repressor